jgi:hypothetical protein
MRCFRTVEIQRLDTVKLYGPHMVWKDVGQRLLDDGALTATTFQNGRDSMRIEPVFLFDLDGALVDSVYQHVLAWKEALDAEGIELSVWRIHRKIGMSGGLFTNQLLREPGIEISAECVERLRHSHAAGYRQQTNHIRPLPGARELLTWFSEAGIPWAIPTSGRTAAFSIAFSAKLIAKARLNALPTLVRFPSTRMIRFQRVGFAV